MARRPCRYIVAGWSMGGRLLVMSVLLLGLAACATTNSPQLQWDTRVSPTPLVWPAAPDVPRYSYVGQLTGEENFRRDEDATAVGHKMVAWLVGLMAGKSKPVVLQRPQSGFTAADGRIYVTDVSRGAVYVFDPTAGRLRVWEMAGKNLRFITPLGIVPGANGQILVADADLARVVRLDHQGHPLGSFGEQELSRPVGLARDRERGEIYVADSRAHDIKIFNDSGKLLRTLGHRGAGPGEFNAPTYLSFAHGRLYVTDTLNARVQIFDRTGKFIRAIGRRGLYLGDLPRPKGVAVDRDGHLYVVESYYDYLLVFDDQGKLLLPIGGTGNAIGRFYLPAGVWLDERDNVYVADSFNGRVMVFKYLGGK